MYKYLIILMLFSNQLFASDVYKFSKEDVIAIDEFKKTIPVQIEPGVILSDVLLDHDRGAILLQITLSQQIIKGLAGVQPIAIKDHFVKNLCSDKIAYSFLMKNAVYAYSFIYLNKEYMRLVITKRNCLQGA